MTNKELLRSIFFEHNFIIDIKYLEIPRIQFICLVFSDYFNTQDNGLRKQTSFKGVSYLVVEDNYLKQGGSSELRKYKKISYNTFIKLLKFTDEKYTIKEFLKNE